MARTRAFLPALLGLAVLAAAATPASAYRNLTHPDPVRVFKKRPFAHRNPIARASSFASTWPCTAQSSDLPPAISSNAPQVKVVYAFPTDGDAFDAYANLMQADAKTVRDRLANGITGEAQNSAKTIRFDTGATGGASCTAPPEQYLDIQTVALSHDHTFYNSGNTFSLLTSELKTKLTPATEGARVNYVVYADRIQATGASGQADIVIDDQKSLESPINQGQTGNGRLFAVVYGAPNTAAQPKFNAANDDSAREATFLHELTHTLGGVQNSAPNSTGA